MQQTLGFKHPKIQVQLIKMLKNTATFKHFYMPWLPSDVIRCKVYSYINYICGGNKKQM